jgi:Rieske 2Fe-2S family protein
MAILDVSQRAVDLAQSRRSGFSLPQAFYTDPELFNWDIERVFLRHWLWAGHISRIPEPGHYFVYEIAGESIIICRGRDGSIQAWFNVCRHRGSRICREPEGKTGSFACPYHAWTYALDGRLLGAPAMADDFDRSEYGLKPCQVRIEHGIILVYLGEGDPPDLTTELRDIEPFVKPYRLAEAKLAARMVWEIQANWKLVVENFAECYHCKPAHPEYCAAMDHAQADSARAPAQVEAFARQTAEWEERVRSLGHHTGHVAGTDTTLHTAGRIPIGGGRLCSSRSGKPLAPLMGDFREFDGGYTSFRIHPGGYFLSPCDHVVLNRFTPLSVNRTLQEMLWLVDPKAVAGRNYDPDELTWLWRVTTEQDLTIIEDNQKGVSSRIYEPGPYSKAEQGPDTFVRWYLRQITPQSSCANQVS